MVLDTVQGTDYIYLFRVEGEEGNAWKVAFQTEGETDESRSYDTTETKDGPKKSAGAYEGTHSLTSLLVKNDQYVKKLKRLVRKANDRLEVWGIDRSDVDKTDTTTLPGEYSIDVVTNVNTSAGSEDDVEVSIETEIEEGVVDGNVEITPALLEMLRQISEELEFAQPTESSGETPE